MKSSQRIAVMTGGGDCPGLNAAIRSVVRSAHALGIEVFGVEQGFWGLYNNDINPIELSHVSGILPRGGTILRSSRFNPFKNKNILRACQNHFKEHAINGLIVIGGDGSLGIGLDFMRRLNIPVIGIPKTIDNDVYGTDITIGFHTAVQIAVDAIDRLHTTAESHDFIMVVEVMGRHCGHLAAHAGLAGGADYILIPERKTRLKEIVTSIRERHARGRNFSIVVVAEDARLYDDKGKVLIETPSLKDEYGKIKLGGVGWLVRNLLQKELGFEARCTVLGHVQRGGSPVAFDRLLATRMGYEAVRLVQQGQWGKLVAFVNGHVQPKPLSSVRLGHKKLKPEMFKVAQVFFS